MTDEMRALELYQLAQSLVDAKGRVVVVGLMAFKEYKGDGLSIRYFPSTRPLEVWQKRKVLIVNREYGQLKVRHYAPGTWEAALEEATK